MRSCRMHASGAQLNGVLGGRGLLVAGALVLATAFVCMLEDFCIVSNCLGSISAFVMGRDCFVWMEAGPEGYLVCVVKSCQCVCRSLEVGRFLYCIHVAYQRPVVLRVLTDVLVNVLVM